MTGARPRRSPGAARGSGRRSPAASVVLFLAAVLVITGSLAGAGNVASADPSTDDWYRLRQCESGNNYAINTGNGYYGAYQFDLSTWRSVGGTGYPHQSSPAVQDALALKLWQQRGWSPWACARIVGLTGSPSASPPSPPPAPIGALDVAAAAGRTVTVQGWAVDPSSPSASIAVHIYINGQGSARTADKPRLDVNAVIGVYGQHGFQETLPLNAGDNSVCVFAISANGGSNTLLRCQNVVGVQAPIGSFDVASVNGWYVTAAGWALDPNVSSTSVPVHLYLNGVFAGGAIANQSRQDVNGALGVGGDHGFTIAASGRLNRGDNVLCAFALGVTQTDNNTQIGCRTIAGPRPPIGYLDTVTVSGSQATVTGWTLDPNSPGSSIEVHVYANSAGAAFAANQSRPDVNAAFGIGGQYGFSNTVALQPGINNVCAYGIGLAGENNNSQLGCTTVQYNPQDIQRQLAAPLAAADGTTVPPPSAATPLSAAVNGSASPTSSMPPLVNTPAIPSPASPAPSTSTTPASTSSVPPAPAASSLTSSSPTSSSSPVPSDTGTPLSGPPPSTVLNTPTAVPSHVGGLDPLVIDGLSGTLTGWVAGPGDAAPGTAVRVTVNGVAHDVLASTGRSDVPQAGLPGAPLGFTDVFTLTRGSNEVCVYEVDPRSGVSTAPLACRVELVR